MPRAQQFSILLTLAERASEGILFSAICSALRFYTAKTQRRHYRPADGCLVPEALGRRDLSNNGFVVFLYMLAQAVLSLTHWADCDPNLNITKDFLILPWPSLDPACQNPRQKIYRPRRVVSDACRRLVSAHTSHTNSDKL